MICNTRIISERLVERNESFILKGLTDQSATTEIIVKDQQNID